MQAELMEEEGKLAEKKVEEPAAAAKEGTAKEDGEEKMETQEAVSRLECVRQFFIPEFHGDHDGADYERPLASTFISFEF